MDPPKSPMKLFFLYYSYTRALNPNGDGSIIDIIYPFVPSSYTQYFLSLDIECIKPLYESKAKPIILYSCNYRNLDSTTPY